MTRQLLFFAMIAGILLPGYALKADDAAAKATIGKAINAAGWDKRTGTFSSWKGKGKMTAAGQSIDFSGDWKTDSATGRYRMDMKITFGGQDMELAFAFDGEKAGEGMGGMKRDVTGPKLEYTKGSGHLYRVLSLKPLLSDAKFKLESVAAKDVDGKPVNGVKVEFPGQQAVTLSFDKDTSLLAKAEMIVKNEFEDWKDVLDETYFSDWKVASNGTKEFKSMKVVRGGKAMLEMTLSDYASAEKPDWATTAFVKP